MGEHITVSCLHCGDEISFEVESWAQPPERAFCDDTCYEANDAPAAKAAAAN